MTSYGEAIDKIRARVNSNAPKILPDICTFSKPEPASGVAFDAFDESTTESQAGAASVPVKYEPLSAYERTVGGKVTQGATHKLTVPVNADTMAIAADQSLVVAARGVTPALTFQVTGPLPDSTSMFLYLAATLRS